MLTQARLKELLSYDPETGHFTCISEREFAHSIKIGDRAGFTDAQGYIVIGLDGKKYKGHRLAYLYMTGEWPKEEVDHKNLSRDDNRWSNLRDATKSQNQANGRTYRNNISGLKGARVHSSGRWQSGLQVSGKRIYLGLHDSPEEAHAAYVGAAKAYFGEYAREA